MSFLNIIILLILIYLIVTIAVYLFQRKLLYHPLSPPTSSLHVTGNGMTKKLNNLKIYLNEEHGKSSNIFTNIITENFPLENVKELVKEWKV